MKKGDIVLMDEELKEIVDLEYITVIVQKLVKKTAWYQMNEYEKEELKRLDSVSWKKLGNKNHVIKTYFPEQYDWDHMKAQATKIIKQVKQHLEENKQTNN